MKRAITSLALILALAGCEENPYREKKVESVKTHQNQAIIMPSQYSNLEILSAGYLGANYAYSKGERSPWISYLNSEGNVIVSRSDGKNWYEIVIDLSLLPQKTKDCKVLSAGYFGGNYAINKGERLPWISFKSEDGNIFAYRLDAKQWKEKSFIKY